MARRYPSIGSTFLLVSLCAGSSVHAQSSELSQAVLALPSTVTPGQRQIQDARLFDGFIRATISNVEGSAQDFLTGDRISFLVAPRTPAANLPTGEGFTIPFVGTRQEFETWAQAHASDLVKVLFPGSLSSGLSGRDTAQAYSQQFLLDAALSTDAVRQAGSRSTHGVGGLVEYERLRRDGRLPGDSAWAWQGLYALSRTVSMQGRFAEQHESLTTRAFNLAADYHPFIEISRAATWRVGATARGGFQYAHAHGSDPAQRDAMTLGSVDVGGGAWMSVRKDFRRMRIGGGSLFQGTKSHVPPGEGDTFRSRFATALNARGIEYDVTFGGTVGFDTSMQTAVTAKYVETYSLRSAADRPPLRLFMAGLSYALGPRSVLTGGFKVSTNSGISAQSVTFQGNFGW